MPCPFGHVRVVTIHIKKAERTFGNLLCPFRGGRVELQCSIVGRNCWRPPRVVAVPLSKNAWPANCPGTDGDSPRHWLEERRSSPQRNIKWKSQHDIRSQGNSPRSANNSPRSANNSTARNSPRSLRFAHVQLSSPQSDSATLSAPCATKPGAWSGMETPWRNQYVEPHPVRMAIT